jgi:hypothetical protein
MCQGNSGTLYFLHNQSQGKKMSLTRKFCLSISILGAFLPAVAVAQATFLNRAISEAEVIAAQKAWCTALVNISEEGKKSQAAAKVLAEKVIDAAYAYQLGPVLFNPTLTSGKETFRLTKDGALSYFVGGDSKYPTDSGFALKDWKKCEIKNAGIVITGNAAMTLGNVMITDSANKTTTVDKTWGYIKDDKGALRIVLHHSSLPYQPK